MNSTGSVDHVAAANRLDWVDYGKGICIIMVVMMHSTLGVEAAAGQQGFMHAVVEFAKPFRMPDFFLISGLFLARVIDRDWRTYIDRKVVHFAYFYVLWVTIQFAVKAPAFAAEQGAAYVAKMYLFSFIEPFGTLWFIYLLPIFFVVTKLTQRVPPAVIWVVGAALEIATIHTGWTVIDEFASRFVYFYSGYLLANYVFSLARDVQSHAVVALVGLAVWALVNGAATYTGVSDWPLMSLVFGFAGCAAIIAVSALLAKMRWLDAIRYCGEHSLVVYLAFFLPMAASRILLLKTGVISDIGTVSLIVTICGVAGAMAWWWAARNTAFRFLFDRPAAFWLTPKPRVTLQAAE
ncbi:acyltransferase family protein [Bradyrhizobium sp. LHD-71]|uniref:acyltransferase family protein n=1 Tax=Bradyrhizobium sp. LHD-71 TaxID=3072141 RepID=UPI0035BE5A6A